MLKTVFGLTPMAVVRLETASGKQWRMVHSGSSYCSQSDMALTFGLGSDTVVKRIQIEWPSGTKQVLENVKARQQLRIKEAI